MITVYDSAETDFTTNGLGPLDPVECVINETLNGRWELTLTHTRDELGKSGRLQMGNIIKAPVPAGYTPRVDESAVQDRVIYKIDSAKVQMSVYLRSGPGTEYKALGCYQRETEVVMIDSAAATHWAEVTSPDGKHGYMYSDYLTYVRTESAGGDDAKERESAALREQPFRIYKIEPGIDTVTVYARHIFYDLAGNLIKEYKPEHASGGAVAHGILDSAMDQTHGFTMYSDLTEAGSADFSGMTPVAALLDEKGLLKLWKAELARDWWDIYAVKRVGRDTDLVIREGKNMLSLGGYIDRSETVTRVVPVGEDSSGNELYLTDLGEASDYIEAEDAQAPQRYEKLKVPNAKVGTRDENNHTRTREDVRDMLIEAAETRIEEGCAEDAVSLDIGLLGLGDVQEYALYVDFYDIAIGDSVHVISESAGIDMRLRLVEYTYDCLARQYQSVTFGKTAENLADMGLDVPK